MKLSGARALVLVALSASIASGVRAADGPLVELDRALRELESTVRSIHHERLEAEREREAGRTNVSRLEVDARDLSRETAALEDETQPLAAQVAALEKERDAARARRAKLDLDRTTLENVLAGGGERGTAPPGVAFAERVRALEARLEQVRTVSVEKDGSVRLGASSTLGATSPAARALADQLAKRAPPAFVRAPIDVGASR